MTHLLMAFLIAVNIGMMFIPMACYNFWNPMAAGFVGGLWLSMILA